MRISALLLLVLGTLNSAHAAISFQFETLSQPGLPVGNTVLFAARPASGSPALQYRYSVGKSGFPLRIVREFASRAALDWTSLEEGVYTIKATARNVQTGETADITTAYTLTPRATSGPVVSPTSNALVFLYSAPGCTLGKIRVRFRATTSLTWQNTPWADCAATRTYNTWLSGMRAATPYLAQHEVDAGGGTTLRGPQMQFRTGVPSGAFPRSTVVKPPDAFTSVEEGVLLHSVTFSETILYPLPFATDLAGNLIWYYDRLRNTAHFGGYLVKPLPGGNMLLILNDVYVGQILREIDVAGNTLRETNMPAVRGALAKAGLIDTSRYFPGAFHHDATRLPNGHTLILGSAEQLVDGVDYLADLVIDLDEDLQPVWLYNSFEHISLGRTPPLNEDCTSPWVDGCAQLFLGTLARDWTHTNTIFYNSPDGNLLLSLRNQDWITKIDYRNGQGTGSILWRLGKDGDFTMSSTDASLWFSHQHDVSIRGSQVLLFDNGNTRAAQNPNANSRGQEWSINELNKTASLSLNADMGVYSLAFGSAGLLSNGNYHFLASGLPRTSSLAAEIQGSGATRGQTRLSILVNAAQYRSWRMKSMYEQ